MAIQNLQQKINIARKQGYSDEQISTYLSGKGISESELQSSLTSGQEDSTTKPSYLTKVGEAAGAGFSRATQGFEQAKMGKDKTPLDAFESGLKLTEGAAGILFSPVAPILEPVNKATKELTDAIGSNPDVQKFANSPAGRITARVAEDLGGLSVSAGLATLGFSPRAVTALTPSEEILANARASASKALSTASRPASDFVTGLRYAISDLDPQVQTILKRSSYDDVNRYFQQAKNAASDPAKTTPLELAGQSAENAFDLINKARSAAVQGKNSLLQEVGQTRLSGNVLNDTISSSVAELENRFGVKVSPNGEITQAKGRVSQLDAADQKLISEYMSRLNSLGVAPTLKQVDDFIDWAQSQLYKQSKTVSKYEVASEPVIGFLKQRTGELNAKLKESVGGGYSEVNARISDLIELQDELSRSLGADARRGGGLMKNLFSPTGGNTRRIFEQIRQETGIDLVKEATLAKYAMESVGDARQSSLLKSLDVAIKGANQLDITKPATWIKFIRENADLDGQVLANEFIRRFNDASAKAPK